MVVNGSCESDWAQVQELAKKFVIVQPSFGYHPWYLNERTERWREELVRYLDSTPNAVVGEIGLDRWKPELPYEGQEETFVWQLRLAAERDIAASIHCLQAWGRMVELLRTEPRPKRGFLLHSYGGSAELIAPMAKLGAYFSFPGYYLHERKERQREVFRQIPLERLLVETDAPDQSLPDALNQHPLTDMARGKAINHPANLRAVYEGLAQVRGMAMEDLATQVEENFKRLFG
ncbi:MAG: TatD-related deoxyribonuclease [Verrucomicrobia bacterium]|nr:TatD-related deoxyribonuclease [Verrucomicrobiota bacterium]